jgi:Protein of unknown function (DUF2723)
VFAQRYVQFWDVGEMQTVPYILGIAHPTGFPAYVLLGFIFSHVVAIGSVAFRMSLFSGVCAAAACATLYATLRDRGVTLWCALVAAFAFAFAQVVWTRATRAEVHTLALCFEALATCAILRWNSSGRRTALLCAWLFEGLAIATHPVAIWLIPGLLFLTFVWRRVRLRESLSAAAAFLVPLLLYAYLPIRSVIVTREGLDPTARLGIPIGQAFWDYGHPAILSNFLWIVSGAEFHKNGALSAIIDPRTYASVWMEFGVVSIAQFGPALVALALLGVYAFFRRNAVSAAGALLCGLCVVPFALSYAEEADKLRYLLETFWITALVIGFGADFLMSRLARLYRPASALVPLALFALLAVQARQQPIVSGPQDVVANLYVQRVIRATADNAIVVAPWIYATPLGYYAYVERAFGNRIVYNTHIEDAVRRLRRLANERPTYVVLDKTEVPGLHLQAVSLGQPDILRVLPAQ